MVRPVIGIDGSRLSRSRKTGTETYSDAVTYGLVDRHATADWRVYLDGDVQGPRWPDYVEIRTITAPRFWTHGRLSLEMAIRTPELLFVPAHVVPLVHPKSVVTIHDLGYLHVPDGHPAHQRRLLDFTTRWNARSATRIIVPSKVTRDDLIDRYQTPAAKIAVVHHGVDERFRTVSENVVSAVRATYGLERPYVLAVGTIHPRKNLPTLARATMRLIASEHDLDLVLIGKDGWMSGVVHDRLRAVGLGNRLRTLGYVPDSDLPGLYRGASCFVQPSLYEGFGIPIVEAMAIGAPVVCARSSSLPEIAGDGADFFNTTDDSELAMVLERILSDTAHRHHLVARGVERSRWFSWSKCVSETASVLYEALSA